MATGKVQVYALGIFYASVCAPADMPIEDVIAEVERRHPCGTRHGWTKADENFRSGRSNPCTCDRDHNRKHWLLAA